MTSNIGIVPTYIQCPFANESDAAYILQNNSSADEIDIASGIKDTVVRDNGNKPVPRDKFNGMLNLATQMPFFLQCGGVLTFDETVSSSIGGYPKGAVLTYVAGKSFNFVTSMKDDNKDNFVENPSFINGVSWKMTSNALIYPDYTKPILPSSYGTDEGKQKLAYHYPYIGEANTIMLQTRHGLKTGEFNYKKATNNIGVKGFNDGEFDKQQDMGIYFRVLSEKQGTRYNNYVTDPPETFEKRKINTNLACGAQIYLPKRGWFYLSLARIARTSSYTNKCGQTIYYQGNPNCAVITLSDGNLGVNSNELTSYYLSSIGSQKYQVISTSFAGHSLAHQCYAWSIQMVIKRACYITIWQDCNPFYMFYNYFELKK